MPAFTYRVIDAAGRRRHGTAVTADAGALQRELERDGHVVLAVTPAASAGESARNGMRPADIEDAMRAIAALLPAGLPLASTLEAAALSAPPSVASALRDARARIEHGETVTAALAAQPGLLHAAALGIIRAGERAGDLDGAFARVAAQLERQGALRHRLLAAAIYPALLAIAGGVALVVLLVFVLPRFADLLSGTGMPLPRSTALLLRAASIARTYWLLAPVAAALTALAARWATVSDEGRRWAARALLTLPVVGAFRRDMLAARAARLSATLLRGGATLLSALDDTQHSMDDPEARAALARTADRVRAGSPLHDALAPEEVFPPLLAALVRTGETAGRLPDFLERSATLFEQRTERDAQRLVAIAEPVLIVVFGILIGAVALAMLQAIYGVNPTTLR